MSDRNPFIIPDEKPMPRRGCPACGANDFSGMAAGGVVTFTCRVCKNQWQGGIGQVAQDPTVPRPPENPRERPIVDFGLNPKEHGEKPVPYQTRRPDPSQTFRGGAPVPNPGEEDG